MENTKGVSLHIPPKQEGVDYSNDNRCQITNIVDGILNPKSVEIIQSTGYFAFEQGKDKGFDITLRGSGDGIHFYVKMKKVKGDVMKDISKFDVLRGIANETGLEIRVGGEWDHNEVYSTIEPNDTRTDEEIKGEYYQSVSKHIGIMHIPEKKRGDTVKVLEISQKRKKGAGERIRIPFHFEVFSEYENNKIEVYVIPGEISVIYIEASVLIYDGFASLVSECGKLSSQIGMNILIKKRNSDILGDENNMSTCITIRPNDDRTYEDIIEEYQQSLEREYTMLYIPSKDIEKDNSFLKRGFDEDKESTRRKGVLNIQDKTRQLDFSFLLSEADDVVGEKYIYINDESWHYDSSNLNLIEQIQLCATNTGYPVRLNMKWNDETTDIIIFPSDYRTASQIEEEHVSAVENYMDDWRESDEKKQKDKEERTRNIMRQGKMESLLCKLEEPNQLNFQDLEAVLRWMRDFYRVAEYGAKYDSSKVVRIFTDQGFSLSGYHIENKVEMLERGKEYSAKALIAKFLDSLNGNGLRTDDGKYLPPRHFDSIVNLWIHELGSASEDLSLLDNVEQRKVFSRFIIDENEVPINIDESEEYIHNNRFNLSIDELIGILHVLLRRGQEYKRGMMMVVQLLQDGGYCNSGEEWSNNYAEEGHRAYFACKFIGIYKEKYKN